MKRATDEDIRSIAKRGTKLQDDIRSLRLDLTEIMGEQQAREVITMLFTSGMLDYKETINMMEQKRTETLEDVDRYMWVSEIARKLGILLRRIVMDASMEDQMMREYYRGIDLKYRKNFEETFNQLLEQTGNPGDLWKIKIYEGVPTPHSTSVKLTFGRVVNYTHVVIIDISSNSIAATISEIAKAICGEVANGQTNSNETFNYYLEMMDEKDAEARKV